MDKEESGELTVSPLYVHNDSGMIFEARLFEEFALLRPILVERRGDIAQIPLIELGESYHLYLGDTELIKEYI